ncbi:hypothetical protein [Streptomyces corynorhini]|uniref:hypothetical protein n=1 Tax=Streptomyces corynorhini TaxID=2282652 RepID=UPI0011C03BD8|nr:hypothetical protein [Streptomyces corynorhini]
MATVTAMDWEQGRPPGPCLTHSECGSRQTPRAAPRGRADSANAAAPTRRRPTWWSGAVVRRGSVTAPDRDQQAGFLGEDPLTGEYLGP